jgi:hypothetical protein
MSFKNNYRVRKRESESVATLVLRKVYLLSELFGPGHFVGLGLRLKSKIRTRTLEIVTFLHLDPKLSVSESFIFGEQYKCVNKQTRWVRVRSPKFSDSDFREVRGLGLGLVRPKSSTYFNVCRPCTFLMKWSTWKWTLRIAIRSLAILISSSVSFCYTLITWTEFTFHCVWRCTT